MSSIFLWVGGISLFGSLINTIWEGPITPFLIIGLVCLMTGILIKIIKKTPNTKNEIFNDAFSTNLIKEPLKVSDFSSAVSILVDATISAIKKQKNCIFNKTPYHILDFAIFLLHIYYLDLSELNLDEQSQDLIDDFLDIVKNTLSIRFKELEKDESTLKLRFGEYRRALVLSSKDIQQTREDLSFLLIKYLTADNMDPIYSPYATWEITELDMEKTLNNSSKILQAQHLVYSKTTKECTLLFSFLNFAS